MSTNARSAASTLIYLLGLRQMYLVFSAVGMWRNKLAGLILSCKVMDGPKMATAKGGIKWTT